MIQDGWCLTHDYAGPRPVIQSRHRTLATARAEYERDMDTFHRRYPAGRGVRYIYPSSLRVLCDGRPGEVVDYRDEEWEE